MFPNEQTQQNSQGHKITDENQDIEVESRASWEEDKEQQEWEKDRRVQRALNVTERPVHIIEMS